MKNQILLISGHTGVGKTTATNKIADWLQNNYTLKDKIDTGYQGVDYLYFSEGKDKKGKFVRIVVNTAADNIPCRDKLDTFLQQHPCNILISAIRIYDFPTSSPNFDLI